VVGIGYAAFFPNVTLSASGGFESSTFAQWFLWPSRFFSIGPSISQTIFNGGLYRAELHQYTAIYNADLAAYRQTVLTVFQQVEDYLAAVRIYSHEIQRQEEAVKSAQEYPDLALPRYRLLEVAGIARNSPRLLTYHRKRLPLITNCKSKPVAAHRIQTSTL
jgi:outer membrane protein TolC